MMKRATRHFLTHSFLVRAAFALTRRVAPIFMLHRFRDVEAGNPGHDPASLRANLSWLRANKFALLSLTELIARLTEGAPIRRAVAFTVDDGYADFARVAAPVFAEFDCPVTVFLSTGFLDGRDWMWWDKVALALQKSGRESEAWPTIETLKHIPESEKLDRIATLVAESGLDLPAAPPARYAPIAWDDVRRLAGNGVTFGPHSVTHPVLARVGNEQAKFEIVESWRRVRAEAGGGAVPVFCYPNGESGDFSVREENVIGREGMVAALSTQPGYASPRDFSVSRRTGRYALPRFAYSDDHSAFVQIASGIERAKSVVRSAIGQRDGRPYH